MSARQDDYNLTTHSLPIAPYASYEDEIFNDSLALARLFIHLTQSLQPCPDRSSRYWL